MITPTVFSPNHRTFRCLGLAGPPDMFSLNPSAGPRVSLTHCFSSFSRNCRPHTRPFAAPPPPLTRRLLATPRRRRARSSPLRRRPRATPPLPRCCSAVARAPAPCLHHLCAANHQAAAIQVLRRHLQRQHAYSNTRAASPAPIKPPTLKHSRLI